MRQLNIYAPEFKDQAIEKPEIKLKSEGTGYVVNERPDTGLILLLPIGAGSIFLIGFLLEGLFDREDTFSILNFGPRFLVSDTGYITWAETFALLVLVLLALGVIFVSFKERLLWHPHRLTLPKRQLQRGHLYLLRHERLAKSSGYSLGSEGVVCAQLVCQEVVKVQVGTDTEYRHNVLYKVPLKPVVVSPSAQGYVSKFEVTIPPDAPPSCAGENSWVAWKLQVKTGLGDKWQDEVDFLLEVV